jgi:lysophospholipase L1-like esterase
MKKYIVLLCLLPVIAAGQNISIGKKQVNFAPGFPQVFKGGVVYVENSFNYNAYADSLFTVMTDLTTPEKRKIDSLFVKLDRYGTADKLDVLNIQIVDSSKYSLLNWLNKNNYPTLSGAPTFLPNIGYRTTTNKYINTNFNPSVDNDKFILTSASYGVIIYKDTVNTSGIDFGARKSTEPLARSSLYATQKDKGAQIMLHNSSVSMAQLGENNGIYSVTNSNDTLIAYKNGEKWNTAVGSGLILDNYNYYLGCYNLNGSPSLYSNRIYSGYYIGSNLTDGDEKIIYDAIADYAESKGVNIIYRSDRLNVVCDGNSLTKGTAGGNKGKTYPMFLQDSLESVNMVDVVYNLGADGQTAMDMDSADIDIEAKWSPYYKRNIVVAWEITNDLFYGATPSQAIDSLEVYCINQKKRNYEVIVITCLPRYNIEAEDITTANTLLKSRYRNFSDKLVDLTGVTELGDYNNTTYFTGDKIHLTEAGYKLVAKHVYDTIKDW